MADLAVDIVSWALIVTGSVFLLIGAIGIIRMPDFFTRLHAAGITDTMGAALLVAGMMVQAGLSLVTVKLFLIGAFLFFTSPTATHAIANAAFVAGMRSKFADSIVARPDDTTEVAPPIEQPSDAEPDTLPAPKKPEGDER